MPAALLQKKKKKERDSGWNILLQLIKETFCCIFWIEHCNSSWYYKVTTNVVRLWGLNGWWCFWDCSLLNRGSDHFLNRFLFLFPVFKLVKSLLIWWLLDLISKKNEKEKTKEKTTSRISLMCMLVILFSWTMLLLHRCTLFPFLLGDLYYFIISWFWCQWYWLSGPSMSYLIIHIGF